jgi:hypothetical protein
VSGAANANSVAVMSITGGAARLGWAADCSSGASSA